MKTLKFILAGSFAILAGTAQAATITSVNSGLSFAGGTTDNSANCPFVAPCLKLTNGGPHSETTLTLSSGGDFTLTSFSYEFSTNSQNQTGNLTVTADGFTQNLSGPGGEYTFTTSIGPVASIFFTNTGVGTVRLGEFEVAPSAVPLPASGLLLLAGFGGFAAMRRKKTA